MKEKGLGYTGNPKFLKKKIQAIYIYMRISLLISIVVLILASVSLVLFFYSRREIRTEIPCALETLLKNLEHGDTNKALETITRKWPSWPVQVYDVNNKKDDVRFWAYDKSRSKVDSIYILDDKGIAKVIGVYGGENSVWVSEHNTTCEIDQNNRSLGSPNPPNP